MTSPNPIRGSTIIVAACPRQIERGLVGRGREADVRPANPRNRVRIFTAAAASTVSGANLGRPLMEITASPQGRVWEGSCQKAMLSSVWPGLFPTVQDDAPAALLR
jgi:hypothetical protein